MHYLSPLNMEKEEHTFEENAFEEHTFKEHEFYTAAAKYWEHIPPTVDGMLGGFGFISQIDIKGSTKFLKTMFEACTSTISFYDTQYYISVFLKY